jgi:hypothetical protein
MKILLRDDDARLYIGANDSWVADPNAATDFKLIENAGMKALERPKQTLAVVLRFDSPECELAINPVFCFKSQKHVN